MNGAEKLGVGEVLTTAFRRFTLAPGPVIAYIIGLAAIEWLMYPTVTGHAPPSLAIFFIAALASMWLGCALVAAALKTDDRRKVGLASFYVPIILFLQVVIISIVIAVPIALGLLLLIVPGVYLSLMWSQMLPLIVSGRKTFFASLGESARLTKNNRGRLFLIFAVLVLATFPLQVAVQMMADSDGPAAAVSGVRVAAFLWTALFSAYWGFVVATIYGKLQGYASDVTEPGDTPNHRLDASQAT
ncbi:MAG: hypothetical protein WD081_04070 [Gammaproteobacteria bacterium]